MEIKEPVIARDQILFLDDPDFKPEHVCLVTGCGTGIGRATAVAAAANGLTVAGLDVNEETAAETRAKAEEMGGKMIFLRTDLTVDAHIENAVAEAAKLGQ
ncbi:MAG: SDR family NAD(P)-dependent oxidoreductase, partial [Thermodesulfobacteriota bacterium]